MSKLPIFLDMDEVICDFLHRLCSDYNNQYDKNVKVDDIKSWELAPHIGENGIAIFNQPGFFESLLPIENAIETIFKLQNEKYEIFIISSPMNEHSVFEKYIWVKRHLPFFPIENLILIGNKGGILEKIDKGILFDDCPDYLTKFKGLSVAKDMPYNQNIQSDYRINNWNDFYSIVQRHKQE